MYSDLIFMEIYPKFWDGILSEKFLAEMEFRNIDPSFGGISML
jgi:hypothetical protein